METDPAERVLESTSTRRADFSPHLLEGSISIPAPTALPQQSATSLALQTCGTGKTGGRARANVLLYPRMMLP